MIQPFEVALEHLKAKETKRKKKKKKKKKRQKDDWERKEKHLLIEENLPSQKN